jgi:heterodisulfide reductase subunit B
MKYFYYPGCSLEGTAQEYSLSTTALLAALGGEIEELPDWNCCGATAAESVSRLLCLALPARNLALAEKAVPGQDILVPCSACYLNMRRAWDKVRHDPATRSQINQTLEEEGLAVSGSTKVRHLLDVLCLDFGADAVFKRLQRSLAGLVVAPYYGCQCLRPYPVFDDPEAPSCMEPLIQATGAKVHPWSMGAVCCGASHMTTKKEVGLALVGEILDDAKGADVIVTVCPMCQMNLEAHQKKISRQRGKDLSISILYLPQLLGMALGLPEKDLGLKLNLGIAPGFMEKLRSPLMASKTKKADAA